MACNATSGVRWNDGRAVFLAIVCRSCCGGIVAKDSAQRKSAVCGGPRNLGLEPDGKGGGGVFEASMLCAAGVFGG